MRSSLGPPTQKRGALAAAVAEIAEITLFKMAASPFTSAMLLALVGPAVLASTGSMCAAMGKRRIVGLNAMPGGMSLRLEKCPWCEMHRDNRYLNSREGEEDTDQREGEEGDATVTEFTDRRRCYRTKVFT